LGWVLVWLKTDLSALIERGRSVPPMNLTANGSPAMIR
jgi:hypothetical protein